MNAISLRNKALGVATLAMVAAGNAMAAVDTTAVTAEIDSAKTAVIAIGGAVLVLLVGIKAYKWVRRAL